MYMHVFASMCLNLCVCVCICFSVLHKTQKGKGCPGQDLVPCNVLSKRESNASKTALTVLGLEHPSTERHVPESTTEPTLALTLHEIWGYLFPVVKYTHIQTIHTYTYIYIQYMQYMHIQAHTCMRQSRSEGVFGGLWQTLYVSGDDETWEIPLFFRKNREILRNSEKFWEILKLFETFWNFFKIAFWISQSQIRDFGARLRITFYASENYF